MISFNEIRGFFYHQWLQKEFINLIDIFNVTSQIYECLTLGVASLAQLHPNFSKLPRSALDPFEGWREKRNGIEYESLIYCIHRNLS